MRIERWAAQDFWNDGHPPEMKIERRRGRKRIKAMDRRELPELLDEWPPGRRRPMSFDSPPLDDDGRVDWDHWQTLGFSDDETRDLIGDHPDYPNRPRLVS